MSTITWTEDHVQYTAAWHSENGAPAPRTVTVADDRLSADHAYRRVKAGEALLWQGDFHNGRQLLQALGRRVDRTPARKPPAGDLGALYEHERARRRTRASLLGSLLIRLGPDYELELRRAPEVAAACAAAYGPAEADRVVTFTELLGVVSAYRWRQQGVEVPALGARVYPDYGVFSPTRSEYVDLVADAPLDPEVRTAFDLGTGTGVLAALLAQRGVPEIVATDINPRALRCAADNAERLGFARAITVTGPALYPPGRADLIVCNPPWLPGVPTSDLERGVYDQNQSMLTEFARDLRAHLTPDGEGWLVLSDLAELLGLRPVGYLPRLFDDAGLRVLDTLTTRPRHPRATDRDDPLAAARTAETTTLWRLRAG
ncbi:methyltransferase [Nocardia alba]|uniref:Methylase of polypeptide subunit release factors n=1 Tax=Nocardia alba TaxID=225051 RepID=A0A4R1FKG7_9NOCA|nr:class I SAM-dependent methyltransferase [Nocardia alba]TCJ95406.1 methylase of polypeptide subunit release factors [Nocardia alba]